MREIDSDKLLVTAASVLLTFLLTFLNRVPRTRGKKVVFHGLFVCTAGILLYFLPEEIQDFVFSPGGVVVIGTILPVYASIVAVCSIREDDDYTWLNFWIVSGTLSYCTEWIDEICHHFPNGGEHWYEFEFLLTVWLILPWTDGASLIFDLFTEPYVSPYARKLKKQLESWVAMILLVVNTSYLFFAWFIFMSFPEEQRRFFVVAVGTVYPTAASIIAVTTKTSSSDNSSWLTYWACFSVLFLCMDYLENFVGHIRGFYSICMVATIYLFLPLFDGATVVFRQVLVPLSGQYENMLLRDAWCLRKSMEKKIPSKYHDQVFEKAALLFMPPKPKTG